MKKLGLVVSSLLFLLLFATACGSNDVGELVPVEDNETQAALHQFADNYKKDMVQAVNSGRMDDLELYLIPNSTFYHLLRSYMKDMQQNNKTLSLVDHSFGDIQVNEYNEYYVDAVEKTEITDRLGQTVLEENAITYVIVDTDSGFKILSILQRK